MSEIVINYGILHELLAGPNGPVVRDLALRAIRVESAAKMNASHTPPSVRGSGPAVRTGRLRSSITWDIQEDAIGVYARIGTNVEYAKWLEGPEQVYDRPFLAPALEAARY